MKVSEGKIAGRIRTAKGSTRYITFPKALFEYHYGDVKRVDVEIEFQRDKIVIHLPESVWGDGSAD
jgi:hypothetical protein